MHYLLKTLSILAILAATLQCRAPKQGAFKSSVIYQSTDLIITRISANAFIHTSFLQTNDFGNVPCNGMIVRNGQEAIIFDTPSNNRESEALITWVQDSLHCRINAIVPTHFHHDCLGGLTAFHDRKIPSFARFKTIELARENQYAIPENGFQDSLDLKVGAEKVQVRFFGEGHTRDNVVGYFPSENVLFGGCLIKEIKAGKGYLGDANVAEWSGTVEKVKKAFPEVKVVVPGHGKHGNRRLLDYTIELFRQR